MPKQRMDCVRSRNSDWLKTAILIFGLVALFVIFRPSPRNLEVYIDDNPSENQSRSAKDGILQISEWDESCFPSYDVSWKNGNSSGPSDPPGLELPLTIWGAIPSFSHAGDFIVIVGPLGSTKARQNGRNPGPHFGSYVFHCYFSSVNETTEAQWQKDPHSNVIVIKCPIPRHEPIRLGLKSSTIVEFRDITHNGHVLLNACLHPRSFYENELAAVIVARNMGCHLETWFEHLFLLGFDHIYFYDHFNDDKGTSAILERYQKQGLVTVFPWRLSNETLWGGKFDRSQIVLYNDALYRFRSKWLYVADVDEFPILTSIMIHPHADKPTFFNHTKAPQNATKRPVFAIPKPQKFNSTFSRFEVRTKFLNYIESLDYRSGYKVGEISLIQLIWGSGRGFDLASFDHCLPSGESFLQSHMMRTPIPEDLTRLDPWSQRKAIIRTSRTKVISVHVATNTTLQVVAPLAELRLHHYWRGGRGASPRTNQWMDTSLLPWAEVIANRVQSRRNGTLIGID